MPKGRKRKQGKRTPAGQLSRAGQRAKPSDWVQAQQDRFGNHYGSALGRAYASGLLGEGNEAKARYDAGKKFTLRYTRTFGGDSYTCPLGDRSGSNDNHDPERDRHQQEWLFEMMNKLDHAGVRPYLDQLLSSLYVDTGPYWLTDLLAGKRHPADVMVLNAAIKALDIIGGCEKVSPMLDIPLHMCNRAVNRS